ncbi:hypothetical protein [Caedibacter taeniospiralis]|uniref:hypothetical protein n=1 Tax=Caedibacter taeniospiralis TaxID=28907 RepID=UPI000C27BC80|nr:hypothetical protein [Caedibacter taeniospiralis]
MPKIENITILVSKKEYIPKKYRPWDNPFINNHGKTEDMSQETGDKTGDMSQETGDKTGDMSQETGDKTEDMSQEIGDKTGDMSQETGDKTGDMSQETGDMSQETGDKTGDMSQETGDKTGDMSQETGDKTGDMSQETGDKTGDMSQETGDKTEDMSQETGDKTGDMSQETGDKTEDMSQETGDKTEDMSQEIGDKTGDMSQETGDKTEDMSQEIGDKTEDMSQETGNKIQLNGCQFIVIRIMISSLENLCLLITCHINTNNIIKQIKSNKDIVKKAIYRLKKKNYISVYERKTGRNGWVKYQIRPDVFEYVKSLQSTQGDFEKNTPQKNESDSHIYNIDKIEEHSMLCNMGQDEKTDSSKYSQSNDVEKLTEELEFIKEQYELLVKENHDLRKITLNNSEATKTNETTRDELNKTDSLTLSHVNLSDVNLDLTYETIDLTKINDLLKSMGKAPFYSSDINKIKINAEENNIEMNPLQLQIFLRHFEHQMTYQWEDISKRWDEKAINNPKHVFIGTFKKRHWALVDGYSCQEQQATSHIEAQKSIEALKQKQREKEKEIRKNE